MTHFVRWFSLWMIVWSACVFSQERDETKISGVFTVKKSRVSKSLEQHISKFQAKVKLNEVMKSTDLANKKLSFNFGPITESGVADANGVVVSFDNAFPSEDPPSCKF